MKLKLHGFKFNKYYRNFNNIYQDMIVLLTFIPQHDKSVII